MPGSLSGWLSQYVSYPSDGRGRQWTKWLPAVNPDSYIPTPPSAIEVTNQRNPCLQIQLLYLPQTREPSSRHAYWKTWPWSRYLIVPQISINNPTSLLFQGRTPQGLLISTYSMDEQLWCYRYSSSFCISIVVKTASLIDHAFFHRCCCCCPKSALDNTPTLWAVSPA